MRTKILEAAKDVFIEEGYEKASIRAIAERIEYSPATIYLYYKDKNELFHEVHELGFEKLTEEFRLSDSIENPFERLRALGHTYMKFGITNPEIYDLMFIQKAPMEAIKETDEGWDCGLTCLTYLKTTLEECIAKQYIQPTEINLLSISIWSYMHGLTSLHIRDRFHIFKDFDIEKLLYGSVELMLGMIKQNTISRPENQ